LLEALGGEMNLAGAGQQPEPEAA
ncbi:MAG: hypothetical protein JWQ76_1157, partial [Ramlibacter sp.]|nr:hypothetical protein [Ramlibacter sp.]